MTFSITDVSKPVTGVAGHKHHWNLDYKYRRNNSDGSIYEITRRVKTNVKEGHGINRSSHIVTAKTIQTIQLWEKSGNRNNITGEVLIQQAVVIVPPTNPYQQIATNLQNHLNVATQTNTLLTQTIATQNQNITNLQNQASQLQQTIATLNSTVEGLRLQVAVLPQLQQQITLLEQQITVLTNTLNQLLIQLL